MSSDLKQSPPSLDSAQLDWLKKIGVVLNIGVADGPTTDANLPNQDARGSAPLNKFGGAGDDGARADSSLSGSPLTERVVAQSAPQIEDTEANWATYRANVNSLADRLRKARQEKPQDPKSAEAHKKLIEVYDKMGAAEVRRDISEAYRLSEELLDRLNDYEKARDAHEKAQKDAAEKQQQRADSRDSLQKKYDEIEYLINDVMNSKDPDLADFGNRIEKLKQAYDSARLSDDITSAKTHLDNLARELQTKLSAESATFAKSLDELGIAGQLGKFYDAQYYPGHALHEVRNKAIEIQKKRAAISDYITANKLVVQAKRKLEEASKREADAAKTKPQREEAAKQGQGKLDAELKALKAELDRFVDHQYPPAAEPKSLEIRDKLVKWKTDWDATLRQGFPFPTSKYGSGWNPAGPNEIRQLFKDYQATAEAFWKKTYETGAAGIKPRVDAALATKKASDDPTKPEQDKVAAKKLEMEDAAAKKDYYQASTKTGALRDQLERFDAALKGQAAAKAAFQAKWNKIKDELLKVLALKPEETELQTILGQMKPIDTQMKEQLRRGNFVQALKHLEALLPLLEAFFEEARKTPRDCDWVRDTAKLLHARIHRKYLKASGQLKAAAAAYKKALEDHKKTVTKPDFMNEFLISLFFAGLGGLAGGAIGATVKNMFDKAIKDAAGPGGLIDAAKDIAKFTTKSLQAAGASPKPVTALSALSGDGVDLALSIGSRLDEEAANLVVEVESLIEIVRAKGEKCNFEKIRIAGDPAAALEKDPFLNILGGLQPDKRSYARLIWEEWVTAHPLADRLLLKYEDDIREQAGTVPSLEKKISEAHRRDMERMSRKRPGEI
jgi:hypothetical protein